MTSRVINFTSGSYTATDRSPAKLAHNPLQHHTTKINQASRDTPFSRARYSAPLRRVCQPDPATEILTLEGRILTDWELYNAALHLGLSVRLREFTGDDPMAFIIVHRLRQPRWDYSQRAVITVRLCDWREPGRPRKPVHGTDLSPCPDGSDVTPEISATTAGMAEAAQVGPFFITRAKRVHGLGLSAAIIPGEISFADAYRRAWLVLDAGLA